VRFELLNKLLSFRPGDVQACDVSRSPGSSLLM
jgi:hypothetical protein